MVEFQPQEEGTTCGSLSSHRELVSSLDMVSSAGGSPRRNPVAGDAVLSPWEPGERRFGPGRVMALSAGCRDRCGGESKRFDRLNVRYFNLPSLSLPAGGASGVRVRMWNSCVCLVPAGLVEPILNSHYDRIVKQLQITAPPTGHCCRWLWTLGSQTQPWMCRCSSRPHTQTESTVEYHGEELDDQKLMKAASYASSSSSSISSLSEQETSRTLLPEVKLSGGEQRPPWRYWRRTGAEPQHRQPGGNINWSTLVHEGYWSLMQLT